MHYNSSAQTYITLQYQLLQQYKLSFKPAPTSYNNNPPNPMFSQPSNPIFSTQKSQQTEQTKQERDLLQAREQMTLAIRKQERDKEIMKRRKMNSTNVLPTTVSMNPFELKLNEFINRQYSITQLNELSLCLLSDNLEKVYYGMIGIRKILSAEKEPPIQMVIDANLVPKIIEFARQNEEQNLKAQATWALSNIASGTTLQTQSVIDKGGVQLFVELLKSENEMVLEQAVWAVANIAADRQTYRDTFLKQGVVNVLCNIIEKCTNLKIVTHSCWALSNIIRTKPTPKFEQLARALKSLGFAIREKRIVEDKVFSQVLVVISGLIQYNGSRISTLLETNLSEKLFELLGSENKEILVAALKLVGTIIYSSEPQLELFMKSGLLQRLEHLLDYPKKLIKKQVCWIIANVSVNPVYLQIIISNQPFVNKLYNLLTKQDITPNIKKQITRFYTHLAQILRNVEIISYFHNQKFILILLNFIKNEDPTLIEVGLTGVSELLKLGQENKALTGGKSVMMADFVNCQGIDILEQAQMHPKLAVYELAASILKRYFEIDDPLQ